jgi:uncharacterized delta-60 repeat protein
LALASLLVLMVWSSVALAGIEETPGDLDLTFDPGGGADVTVETVTLQPDGKVLIGGDFTHVSGTGRNYVARLDDDGALDLGFDPGTGPDGGVRAVAVQSETKVLIGGLFTTVGITPANHIARLEADGSLDDSFDPGEGANGAVMAIAVQADGKIVVGGAFTTMDVTSRSHVARLHGDGSLDTGFLNGLAGANGTVYAVASQPDGQVLIGGAFTHVNGTLCRYVARLNDDGTLDPTFDPGEGASDQVRAVVLQPDGKILVGGAFQRFAGVFHQRITRLDADGSVDAGFDPGGGANNWVRAIAVQDDGRVLIGGTFTTIGDTNRAYLARLHACGSLDVTFGAASSLNGSVRDIVLQDDGKVLIGGLFTAIEGTPRHRIARLIGEFANRVYLPLVLR